MIGDKLTYHSNFKKNNNEIISELKEKFLQKKRICIAVAGESGSGKTSLAYALFLDLEKELGIKGFTFHGDDYFRLPPKDNHKQRLNDINNVGTVEVNLQLLDQHIASFLDGDERLIKPLVNYGENTISEEIIYPSVYDFCIVEGTYTMLLEKPSYKVFIEDSYKDTKLNRANRARDIMNDFNEQVLEIEHNIIKKQIKFADLTVKNNI
ncbi:hypothetical protein [Winogradskyella sp. PG-2]|uniref:hypothetical protein n=1 Tax=Winogradskyella sp. PG-2 TaxID=754409 RepID=UPI000458914D|nr:hypothetical protein [Winogradskyella sp. PG-2]BAO76117.1 phosphoribulokinase/uridine kinase [Winogradskyella sp. PG-2]